MISFSDQLSLGGVHILGFGHLVLFSMGSKSGEFPGPDKIAIFFSTKNAVTLLVL